MVSRFLLSFRAIRIFGIPCSWSSQQSVINVLFCMSMIVHGLSDFYGNIAPGRGMKNGCEVLAHSHFNLSAICTYLYYLTGPTGRITLPKTSFKTSAVAV